MIPQREKQENTSSSSFGVTGIILSVLTAAILIYSVFHVPLSNAVNCEKDARVKADDEIKGIINAFLMQNEKDHGKISNQLTRLIALMDRAEKSERLGNTRT